MGLLGELLVKLGGDASGLQRAVDEGKRALNELPGAAKQAAQGASTGLGGVGAVAQSTGLSVGALALKITAVGGALVGLKYLAQGVGAALTGALMGPIRSMAQLSEEAYAFGATTTQLSRLQIAAGQVGLTIDQLRQGVGLFAAKLDEANTDKLSRSFAVFKTLGVDITQGALPALLQFMQKVAALPDTTQQLQLAGEMAGGRIGRRLIVLGADLDAVMRAVDRTGAVITDEMGAMSDAAEDAVDRMHAAFEGLKDRAIAPLAPVIERAADRLTDFFATDPRGLQLATSAVNRIGDALDYVTRPDSLAAMAETTAQLGNLAGALFRSAQAAAQLAPELTSVLNALTKVLGLFNAMPAELQGALFGAFAGARFGAAGAAIGAVGGAMAGSMSRAPTTDADLVQQRVAIAEQLRSVQAERKTAAEREAIARTVPEAAGRVPMPGRPLTEIVKQEWELGQRLAAIDRDLATSRARSGQLPLTSPPTPQTPTPPPSTGGRLVIPDLKAQEKEREQAGRGGDRGQLAALREAERLAAFWADAPAQLDDIRDGEERLAVTREAVFRQYEETARKLTTTEALGVDYWKTVNDLADDATAEADRAAAQWRDFAATITDALGRLTAFGDALDILFSQGPIERRTQDVLERRLAEMIQVAKDTYEVAAQQGTTTGASIWAAIKAAFGGGTPSGLPPQGTATSTTSRMDPGVVRSVMDWFRGTGTAAPAVGEGTVLAATSGAPGGVPAAAGQGGLAGMAATAMGYLSAATSIVDQVNQVVEGFRSAQAAADAAKAKPGVTQSEMYGAYISRIPYIGSLLETFNKFATNILGKNAPGAVTGALGGALTGASIGAFAGPLGAAIGAVAGAALGAIFGNLFKPPTAEAQLNRVLARYVNEVGVPRILPGDRGINLRAFGRSGGPTQPAYADLDAQTAAFAGRLFATEAGKLPERGAIPGRIQNFLLNTATALKLTAEESDRLFKRFEQPLFGKNLDDALLRLASLRAQGRITGSDMQAGFGRALQIFEDLPKAIDADRLSLAALGKDGRLNFETLKNAARDAQQVLVTGMGDTFEVLVKTASAEAAGRNLATTFAGTFLQAVQQELAQAPLSSLLTDAVVTARQAAVAFREGDRVEARRLLLEARQEFAKGRQELLGFLQPIAFDTRAWSQGLTGASGVINQTGRGIPSFDVGGMVPGAIGTPLLATVHGGEMVLRPQDTQQMIGLLSQVATAVQRGWSVVVQDRSTHVLTVDGRELSRVQADTETMHRGTGMVLPRGNMGVR